MDDFDIYGDVSLSQTSDSEEEDDEDESNFSLIDEIITSRKQQASNDECMQQEFVDSKKRITSLEEDNEQLLRNIHSLWKTSVALLNKKKNEIQKLEKRNKALTLKRSFDQLGKDDFFRLAEHIAAYTAEELGDFLKELQASFCSCQVKQVSKKPGMTQEKIIASVLGKRVNPNKAKSLKKLMLDKGKDVSSADNANFKVIYNKYVPKNKLLKNWHHSSKEHNSDHSTNQQKVADDNQNCSSKNRNPLSSKKDSVEGGSDNCAGPTNYAHLIKNSVYAQRKLRKRKIPPNFKVDPSQNKTTPINARLNDNDPSKKASLACVASSHRILPTGNPLNLENNCTRILQDDCPLKPPVPNMEQPAKENIKISQDRERMKRSYSPKEQDRRKRSLSPKELNRGKRSSSPKEQNRRKRSSSPKEQDRRKRSYSPKEQEKRNRSSSPKEQNRRKRSSSPKEQDTRKRSSSPKEQNRRKRSSSPKEQDTRKRNYSPKEQNRRKRSPSPIEQDRRKRSYSPKEQERRNRSSSPKEQGRKMKNFSPKEQGRRKRSPLPKGQDSRNRSYSPKEQDKRTKNASPNEPERRNSSSHERDRKKRSSYTREDERKTRSSTYTERHRRRRAYSPKDHVQGKGVNSLRKVDRLKNSSSLKCSKKHNGFPDRRKGKSLIKKSGSIRKSESRNHSKLRTSSFGCSTSLRSRMSRHRELRKSSLRESLDKKKMKGNSKQKLLTPQKGKKSLSNPLKVTPRKKPSSLLKTHQSRTPLSKAKCLTQSPKKVVSKTPIKKHINGLSSEVKGNNPSMLPSQRKNGQFKVINKKILKTQPDKATNEFFHAEQKIAQLPSPQACKMLKGDEIDCVSIKPVEGKPTPNFDSRFCSKKDSIEFSDKEDGEISSQSTEVASTSPRNIISNSLSKADFLTQNNRDYAKKSPLDLTLSECSDLDSTSPRKNISSPLPKRDPLIPITPDYTKKRSSNFANKEDRESSTRGKGVQSPRHNLASDIDRNEFSLPDRISLSPQNIESNVKLWLSCVPTPEKNLKSSFDGTQESSPVREETTFDQLVKKQNDKVETILPGSDDSELSLFQFISPQEKIPAFESSNVCCPSPKLYIYNLIDNSVENNINTEDSHPRVTSFSNFLPSLAEGSTGLEAANNQAYNSPSKEISLSTCSPITPATPFNNKINAFSAITPNDNHLNEDLKSSTPVVVFNLEEKMRSNILKSASCVKRPDKTGTLLNENTCSNSAEENSLSRQIHKKRVSLITLKPGDSDSVHTDRAFSNIKEPKNFEANLIDENTCSNSTESLTSNKNSLPCETTPHKKRVELVTLRADDPESVYTNQAFTNASEIPDKLGQCVDDIERTYANISDSKVLSGSSSSSSDSSSSDSSSCSTCSTSSSSSTSTSNTGGDSRNTGINSVDAKTESSPQHTTFTSALKGSCLKTPSKGIQDIQRKSSTKKCKFYSMPSIFSSSDSSSSPLKSQNQMNATAPPIVSSESSRSKSPLKDMARHSSNSLPDSNCFESIHQNVPTNQDNLSTSSSSLGSHFEDVANDTSKKDEETISHCAVINTCTSSSPFKSKSISPRKKKFIVNTDISSSKFSPDCSNKQQNSGSNILDDSEMSCMTKTDSQSFVKPSKPDTSSHCTLITSCSSSSQFKRKEQGNTRTFKTNSTPSRGKVFILKKRKSITQDPQNCKSLNSSPSDLAQNPSKRIKLHSSSETLSTEKENSCKGSPSTICSSQDKNCSEPILPFQDSNNIPLSMPQSIPPDRVSKKKKRSSSVSANVTSKNTNFDDKDSTTPIQHTNSNRYSLRSRNPPNTNSPNPSPAQCRFVVKSICDILENSIKDTSPNSSLITEKSSKQKTTPRSSKISHPVPQRSPDKTSKIPKNSEEPKKNSNSSPSNPPSSTETDERQIIVKNIQFILSSLENLKQDKNS